MQQCWSLGTLFSKQTASFAVGVLPFHFLLHFFITFILLRVGNEVRVQIKLKNKQIMQKQLFNLTKTT